MVISVMSLCRRDSLSGQMFNHHAMRWCLCNRHGLSSRIETSSRCTPKHAGKIRDCDYTRRASLYCSIYFFQARHQSHNPVLGPCLSSPNISLLPTKGGYVTTIRRMGGRSVLCVHRAGGEKNCRVSFLCGGGFNPDGQVN